MLMKDSIKPSLFFGGLFCFFFFFFFVFLYIEKNQQINYFSLSLNYICPIRWLNTHLLELEFVLFPFRSVAFLFCVSI